MRNSNSLSLMIKTNSPTEIEDIITKSDIKKQTGPNSLLQPLLKSIKKVNSHPSQYVQYLLLTWTMSNFFKDIVCNNNF